MQLPGTSVAWCLVVLALGVSAEGEGGTVTGTVKGAKGPVPAVEATLKQYGDARCADLSNRPGNEVAPQEQEYLDKCKSIETKAVTDDRGVYRFQNLTPGWYSLTFKIRRTERLVGPIPSADEEREYRGFGPLDMGGYQLVMLMGRRAFEVKGGATVTRDIDLGVN